MYYRNSYIRKIFSFLLLMGMLVHALHAQEIESSDLKIEIQKISKKLNSLEKVLLQRLSAIDKKLATSTVNPLENEAKNAFNQINTLIGQAKYEEAKASVAEFMKKYGSTKYARNGTRLQKELEVIGKEAPKEWGIEKWIQGQDEVDLDSAPTTLLVFWEVWCGYCKREVPKLQELYNKQKENGLQLVGFTKINKSATEEKLTDFIKKNNVQYPVAKEDGSLSQYFNVSGIPAAAIIHNGFVVWRGHPARLPEDLLQSWL